MKSSPKPANAPANQTGGRGVVMAPRLLSPEDVAALTLLSVETLAQWRSQKRGIPYVKISRNCVRYRQSDLDVWLSERIVRTDEGAPTGRGRT